MGPAAWSLMLMGAAGQHNHRSAGRGNDLALREVSRNEALTGRRFDASTWLGWVGQPGWVHDYGGKANVFRPNARACLYIGPSEESHGQLVYDFDRNKVDTVRAVSLGHDPSSMPFVVATSDLYRPMGAVGMPDPSAYTIRLRSMLLPGVDPAGLMVAHDPLSGEPAYLYGPVPLLDEEGDIVVVPARLAPDPDAMPDLADLSDDDSDVDEGDFGSSLESGVGPQRLRAVPAGQHRAPVTLDAIAASSPLAALMAAGVKGMDGLAPDTPLVFDPGAKAPSAGGAMSLSRARYLLYSAAVTVAEFRALHPGTAAEARRPRHGGTFASTLRGVTSRRPGCLIRLFTPCGPHGMDNRMR